MVFLGSCPLLATGGQLGENVGYPIALTLGTGTVAILIFLASFLNKKSYWQLTKFDLICGALSFCGLVLWQITQIGNIAILFGILADGFAGLPTLKKAFQNPESETAITFLFDTVAVLITFATIKVWNFQNAGFSIYLLFMVLPLFLLIKFKLGPRIQKRFA